MTRMNLEMLERARPAFVADAEPEAAGSADVCEIMEITIHNHREHWQAADADFLARVELLSAVHKRVLVSDLPTFYALGEYLAERSVARAGFVIGVPLLRDLFNETFYTDLSGGILEAFGRLFTRRVRLYVYPTRASDDGRVVTADSLDVPPHLVHLLEHLRANGMIRRLTCDEATLRTYSSDDVRRSICDGDPSWKEYVAPEVAAHIEAHGIAGFTCEL